MPTIFWIGLAFAVIGIFFMRREHRIILKSLIVEGRVIEMISVRSLQDKSPGGFIPKVIFKTMEGREIVFNPKVGSSTPGVSTGDRVLVAYNRENPSRARLLTFGYRFGFWYTIVGLGLLIMYLGYGFNHGKDWMQRAYISETAWNSRNSS
jgi:hypothetical protein